jgi:hypothetical protein
MSRTTPHALDLWRGHVCERAVPHYDLEAVRSAFRGRKIVLPARVERHMVRRGMSRGDLVSCVAALRPQDFHKSQAHTRREGVWLDIYRPWVAGDRMYLKFTEHEDGEHLLVLSFCRDGEAH